MSATVVMIIIILLPDYELLELGLWSSPVRT